MARATTIDDVAQLAGVSRSAVSRVFTPGASASPATREKVAAAAETLRYRPNLVARSLSKRRSNIVAIGTTRLGNAFHADLLEALSTGLQREGLRGLLFTVDGTDDPDPPLDEMLHHQVDGVVLLSVRLSSSFATQCRALGVPLVLVNRTALAEGAASVVVDNRAAGRVIAEFLLAGGHRRLAFMAGMPDASTSIERERGFTEALDRAGLPLAIRTEGRFDFATSCEAARTLLAAPDRPDALFCANDHMALAALHVARREFGIDVGRALSIVGFDDSRPAGWAGIDLTSFSQPVADMAAGTVALLMERLAAPDAPAERRLIDGHLVVRDTARLPPGGVVMADGGRRWVPWQP